MGEQRAVVRFPDVPNHWSVRAFLWPVGSTMAPKLGAGARGFGWRDVRPACAVRLAGPWWPATARIEDCGVLQTAARSAVWRSAQVQRGDASDRGSGCGSTPPRQPEGAHRTQQERDRSRLRYRERTYREHTSVACQLRRHVAHKPESARVLRGHLLRNPAVTGDELRGTQLVSVVSLAFFLPQICRSTRTAGPSGRC